MAKNFAGYRTFFKEFRTQFHTTGAVLPSSRFLGRALARYVGEPHGEPPKEGRHILEVGPGSGAVTDQLVRRLGPLDRLDLVEVNGSFVAMLEGRFASEPELRRVADRVRVFHEPVESMQQRGPYDLVISGLPLNNFAADQVAHFMQVFQALLKPAGRLSFFEYIAIRRLRGMLCKAEERERLRRIGEVLNTAFEQEVRREAIWLNVPPAWVHHLEFLPPVRTANGR